MTARKEEPKVKRVPWKELGKDFLEQFKDKSYEEIAAAVEKKCGTRPAMTDIRHAFDRFGIKRKWAKRAADPVWTDEMKDEVIYVYGFKSQQFSKGDRDNLSNLKGELLAALKEKSPGVNWVKIAHAAARISQDDIAKRAVANPKLRGIKAPLKWGNADASKKAHFEKREARKLLLEAKPADPHILKIDPKHSAWTQKGACIGFWSRIDFGSGGYRRGLVRLAGQTAQKHGTHFNILAAGLVDKRSINVKLQATLRALKESDYWRSLTRNEKKEEEASEKEALYREAVNELAQAIPQIRTPSGELAKLYIITSPVIDGDIGEQIAKRLAEARSEDIVYWANKTDVDLPLFVKYVNKKILVVVPTKPPWRSKYYSTSPQRELEDVEKRSARDLPDVYVLGGFAASVDRPEGESLRPWFTTGALSNIMETRSAENQICMRFLKYDAEGAYSLVNRSFKDLVSIEREFVKTPKGLNPLQLKIFEEIKRSPKRLGVIEHNFRHLGNGKPVSQERIKEELAGMLEDGKNTGIVFNESSGVYDISADVIQHDIQYPFVERALLLEDNVVGAGCLHALATYCDHRFFVNEFPKLIVKRKAKLIVMAGDLTQGLKHDMLERGEVYAGANDSQQEDVAGHLVGEVEVRVFREYFEEEFKPHTDKKLNEKQVGEVVKKSLCEILVVSGNHDDWKKGRGITPLKSFYNALEEYVTVSVRNFLKDRGLFLDGIREIVRSKIIKDDLSEKINYTTPNGLKIKTCHPGTARTETISISSQRVLAKYRNAQLVIPANWHQAVVVQHYEGGEKGRGQCFSLQCPTICTHTIFEDGKMKVTDFGVGFARIYSKCVGSGKDAKLRIVEVESGFFGKKSQEEDLHNVDIINQMLTKELGCMPIPKK